MKTTLTMRVLSTGDEATQPWEWLLDLEWALMVGGWTFSRDATKLKFGLHIWPISAFQLWLSLLPLEIQVFKHPFQWHPSILELVQLSTIMGFYPPIYPPISPVFHLRLFSSPGSNPGYHIAFRLIPFLATYSLITSSCDDFVKSFSVD